ncbi:hypothetical protein HDU67_001629, partial [Dinochytrium kinnereticum]
MAPWYIQIDQIVHLHDGPFSEDADEVGYGDACLPLYEPPPPPFPRQEEEREDGLPGYFAG